MEETVGVRETAAELILLGYRRMLRRYRKDPKVDWALQHALIQEAHKLLLGLLEGKVIGISSRKEGTSRQPPLPSLPPASPSRRVFGELEKCSAPQLVSGVTARCVRLADVEVRQETPRAFLVHWHGELHWIPKSQLCEGTTVNAVGECGDIVMTAWVAEQKGWM